MSDDTVRRWARRLAEDSVVAGEIETTGFSALQEAEARCRALEAERDEARAKCAEYLHSGVAEEIRRQERATAEAERDRLQQELATSREKWNDAFHDEEERRCAAESALRAREEELQRLNEYCDERRLETGRQLNARDQQIARLREVLCALGTCIESVLAEALPAPPQPKED